MVTRTLLVVAASCTLGCAQISGSYVDLEGRAYEPYQQIQGFVGIIDVNPEPTQLNSALGSIVEEDEPTTAVFGATAFNPLVRGNYLEFGGEIGGSYASALEGGLIDNGSAIVPSDNEVTLGDFFIGLYLNAFLAQRVRVYVSGGPSLQYGRVDYEFRDSTGRRVGVGDSGYGGGIYARAGIEFEVRPGHYAGFGARWIDSTVNLGGGLADYDFEAFQFLFTVTTGF